MVFLVSKKVAAASFVIGCTMHRLGSGRSDFIFVFTVFVVAQYFVHLHPRREAHLLYTALDVNAIAEPHGGSQPFIESGF